MIITIDMVSGEIIEDSTTKEANVTQDMEPLSIEHNIEIPGLSQLEITDSVPHNQPHVLFDISNIDIDEFIDGM